MKRQRGKVPNSWREDPLLLLLLHHLLSPFLCASSIIELKITESYNETKTLEDMLVLIFNKKNFSAIQKLKTNN